MSRAMELADIMKRVLSLVVFMLCLFKQEIQLLTRKRWIRRCCCAFAIFVVLGIILIWFMLFHAYNVIHSCTDRDSREYLQQLCSNYSRGLVTGSLCRPLCETKEIEFEECLGHGVKLHVLRAKWNGKTVILKTVKPLGSGIAVSHVVNSLLPGESPHSFTMTRKVFVEKANSSIYHNMAGKIDNKRTIEVVEEIFSECDIGNDGILHYNESFPCWQLLKTDEYVLYKLLRELNAMLKVYGVCGNMYAVQYAAAEPFLGFQTSWSDGRDWRFRARLALALLDMIEEFEYTPYGTFYMCDVQEPNFGVVKRSDGKLIAKAIDVDICMFRSSLLSSMANDRETGLKCKKDTDCTFFSCLGECDKTTGVCSGKLMSNNFVLLCLMVFTKRHEYHANLLCNPPTSIAEPLKRVLKECSKPVPTNIDWELFRELKSILSSSIQ